MAVPAGSPCAQVLDQAHHDQCDEKAEEPGPLLEEVSPEVALLRRGTGKGQDREEEEDDGLEANPSRNWVMPSPRMMEIRTERYSKGEMTG